MPVAAPGDARTGNSNSRFSSFVGAPAGTSAKEVSFFFREGEGDFVLAVGGLTLPATPELDAVELLCVRPPEAAATAAAAVSIFSRRGPPPVDAVLGFGVLCTVLPD